MTRYSLRMMVVLCTICIHTIVFSQSEQSDWQPKNVRLATRWTAAVSPTNALKEYPRPQMVRSEWINLNGLWDYAVTDTSVRMWPVQPDGQILVPFPIESSLSGVQRMLKAGEYLWYRKEITLSNQPGKRTLLHFGAVDNEATVYVNNIEAGSHQGGYTSFTLDITSYLKNGINVIVVKVKDPTDQGVWPHGKQVSNPANIYYTPSSGIWQTVWLETVPETYIADLKLTPDIDNKIIRVTVDAPKGYSVKLTALNNRTVVSEAKGKTNSEIELPIFDPKLWSPERPFLYDLKVELLKGSRVVDEVMSYFGMRKVSIGKDERGFSRIFINNKYVYNLGTLDQGFWPDGLYTAPTDEALQFDIAAIKAMGFNTIRKHIKVEPARWYYHADKLGMLVWQDFVNPNQSLPEGSKPAFEQGLQETMEQLKNSPSIILWTLFNERWGAYDQQRLTEMVKRKDTTRLVNGHSGELLWVNDQLRAPSADPWVSSDLADIHVYPDPANVPDASAKNKVKMLGEFGGIGVFIPDHQWLSNKSWGYVQVLPSQLPGKYTIMNQHLQLLEKEGLAASIYTQPFDVEGEENGLLTYDREVVKIPFDTLRKIHSFLVPDIGTVPLVTAQNADLTDPGILYSQMLQQYIDGRREAPFLKKLSMMAAQVGDKDGSRRIGQDYIAGLRVPLSEEDIRLVAQFVSSTRDAGFAMIRDHAEDFERVIGERQYAVNMMNMIYNDEMKAMIEANAAPDWNAIEARVKLFGEPGEEILLRAQTVYFINKQDWTKYVPVAKAYLSKYGANVPESERKMFQQAIDQHNN